ncbi:hypothetical protein [Paraburkholderia phenazinium]|jgi:hypothetical protein|uniref:Uncharacterized protein n=1 Tax=Paraburkholderia phenazinium TaxID=60549 RepID=A0A1G8FA43_9BURK|nr:hypothetical protein [Paraburkholderia phenazinium]SDH78839.1 hypothetical protein SAMN05216466_11396 [Paraburkholderia phenazinium]
MPETTAKPARMPEAIEKDFMDLMASRLPVTVAREKFERLWDEVNTSAAQLVGTERGSPYLALLKRMHETFENHYRGGPQRQGRDGRRP